MDLCWNSYTYYIDLFSGLAFLQETMKYTSIIRNTFYGIINSTHTWPACAWLTTTSSNLCEHEIALESDIGTGISMSKYYNLLNSVIYAILVTIQTQKMWLFNNL